jgi:hypothetical protein
MPRGRLLPLALTSAALAAAGPEAIAGDPPAARRVEARVDPRVELLAIVFRLAGNPEYQRGKVPAYTEAVEARFGKLRGHDVVKHAAALRRERGVSFDAVMSLAVHLDPKFHPAVALAKAERLDRRWPVAEIDLFLEELRDFAERGGAAEFFRSQRDLYETTARRMQEVLDAKVKMDWFDGFFGSRPTARFSLSLGLLNGGGCYGPSVLRADGTEDLHCVLGVWMTDAEGRPAFDGSVVPTVVHEFCHSYCNALVDAHLKELRPAAERLWPDVADAMRSQAYAEWPTMMRESLVRACVVRCVLATDGREAALREAEEQRARSFAWTADLAALLGEYEADRKAFPALDAFMPRVGKFFAEYADRAAAEAARAPKVESIVPSDGAKDVDPALTAIVVTFDRPMMDGAWAVVGGGPHFPKTTGKPSYDAARRVLTIPVALDPEWDYELWLNRGKFDSFRSADGVRLRSVHLAFRTRAR